MLERIFSHEISFGDMTPDPFQFREGNVGEEQVFQFFHAILVFEQGENRLGAEVWLRRD
jgi:hypothetical protein